MAQYTSKYTGPQIDGNLINNYSTCSTEASTQIKEVSTEYDFLLEAGATVRIKFTDTNTADSPLLKFGKPTTAVAKNIFYNGTQITTGENKSLLSGICDFVYDGTQYNLIGKDDLSLYLPLSGGQMTGDISYTFDNRTFALSNANAGSIDVGWNYYANDGAGIGLRSNSYSTEENKGAFYIYARDSSGTTKALEGKPDGTFTWAGNTIWDTGSLNIQGAYRYSIGAGKTVKLSFGTYYQAIVFGRATNGSTNDLILIGVGYSSINHWRALYRGSQCSWGASASDRSIEIKNTYSEGSLYITVLMLRSAVIFTEIEDLTVTPVTAVMALTTSTVANASTADSLTTARTLWGQSFNGSANVSGNMTGVGTIDANGDISVTRTTTTASKFLATNSKGSVSLMTSTNRGIYDDTNSKWLITTNGTNTWLNCGNVAIAGGANTSYKLYVDGTVGATNFYTTSDRSKKENIEQFSEHISKFTLKETGKEAYGVIALDVPEMFREGEEGNYTVNYISILSYYIGTLENKVLKLEDEVQELKKQVNNG